MRHYTRDWVRIELESALNRKLPVIPILIDHARMPCEAELPPSLARLAYRNAIDVDQGRDFHPHVDRLIRGVEFHLQLTNSLDMTLIRIEPGSFQMGSSNDQIDQVMRLFTDSKRASFDHEQPQHTVKITGLFYLGRCQVTQGQYKTIMGYRPSLFKGSDELPVENVSWLQAVEFCNRLSEKESQTPYYRIDDTEVTALGGDGYRLPTEAEWEYSCRAGTSTFYPFGDDPGMLGEYAWYSENSANKTHAVGQKKPNAWGLHDMLGNVWEWCADGYDAKYYASSPPADSAAATGPSGRVVRGGGHDIFPRNARSANRGNLMPGDRYIDVGFRLARGQSGR